MSAGVDVLLRRRPVKVVVDVALLVGFVVAFATRERDVDPTYVVHAWVGLALVVVVGAHLVSNRAWIARVRANGRADRQARLAAVNLTFGAMVAVCIATGIPLWLSWTAAGAMRAVHAGTGFLAVVLMVVHVVMNRHRIGMLLGLRRRRPRG